MSRFVLVLGFMIAAMVAPLQVHAHPDDEPDNSSAAKPILDPAKGSLFLSLNTSDAWRGWMGLQFAYSTLLAGHPVAIFLNFDAVKLAATTTPQAATDSQRPAHHIIADFIRDGGKVLVCPACLREVGIATDDLVSGVEMGRAGIAHTYLFAENTRTLSW